MKRFAVIAVVLYVIWLAGYFVIVPLLPMRDMVVLYGDLPFLIPVLLIGGLLLAERIARRLHL